MVINRDFADANYGVVATCSQDGTVPLIINVDNQAAGSFDVKIENFSSTDSNSDNISLVCLGAQ